MGCILRKKYKSGKAYMSSQVRQNKDGQVRKKHIVNLLRHDSYWFY
jgi:hypothetical protein